MIINWERVTIYVRPGPTDMRKEINGLAVLVEEELACDPFSGSPFSFLQSPAESPQDPVLGQKRILADVEAAGEGSFPVARGGSAGSADQRGATSSASGRHRLLERTSELSFLSREMKPTHY